MPNMIEACKLNDWHVYVSVILNGFQIMYILYILSRRATIIVQLALYSLKFSRLKICRFYQSKRSHEKFQKFKFKIDARSGWKLNLENFICISLFLLSRFWLNCEIFMRMHQSRVLKKSIDVIYYGANMIFIGAAINYCLHGNMQTSIV